ncbi:MAG: DUF2298 domain-containing protein [Acidimicrobiales bacterium]|jgi:YYY domain-containing protein|nr:DUF2298 domain-containing protein [Acidimicrobiales bacterium]
MTALMGCIRNHKTFLRRLGLILLLLLAFTLRVWNLNWDQGTHQHPDERYWSIVTADIDWENPIDFFDTNRSEMNPYQYRDTWVYGTLPLFTTKAVAEFLENDSFVPRNLVSYADKAGINLLAENVDANGNTIKEKSFNSGYEVQLVGRLLSALLDTGTVFLIYLLGIALFNRTVGYLSSILLTFTPLHIQYSHFHGAESWVTFFVTAVVLLSIYLYRINESTLSNAPPRSKGILLRASFIGALIGMAIASKFTAVFVFVVPLTVYLIAFFQYRASPRKPNRGIAHITEITSLISITGLSAIFTFRIFQPYAFDGLGKLSKEFLSDLNYLEAVSSGGDYPWIVQWVGRTKLFYPLESIFWSGMGPAISIAVCIGLALGVAEIIRRSNFMLLAPLSFVVVMVGLVAQQFNPLIRYLLPMYPTVIVFGGYGIYRLWLYGVSRFKEHGRSGLLGKSAVIGASLCLGLSIFWGVAFVNGIYNSPHPRIEASAWINQNIETGSTLSSQLWDDSLPLRSQGMPAEEYELIQLDLFRPDSWVDPQTGVTKPELLLSKLDQIDYIVEASNRLHDAIPRLPAEYPATSAYYRSLFTGGLGFDHVATFENKPSLFGVDLPSRIVEETFSVYDHPTVTIWKKAPNWSLGEARKILNPYAAAKAPNLEPKVGAWNALMLQPQVNENLQDGSTFNERFSPDGIFASFSWLWWFLWLQLSSFLVLPWSLSLFSSFKDGGYGLSKILGFVSTGMFAWVVVSWDLADFSKTTCLFALFSLCAFGLWNGYRKREYLIELAITHRKIWVLTELVFIVVFFSVLLLRYMNPDLWESYRGGEKPMELGYLTAIGRSSDLPPYDPWFAGGVMNYYYFGWFLLAVPMLTIGVLPEVAFQLGVATFVALAVMGVWTLALNLIKYGNQDVNANSSGLKNSLIFGTLAISLFGFLGTFDAVRRHHQRFRGASSWNFFSDWPLVGSAIEFVGGFWEWMNGAAVQAFDWWGPSRVNSGNFDITEFPFFTFLFGDLHPHLMGMPLFGLILCLCLAYVLSCRKGTGKTPALLATVIGLALSAVRMSNTWDFPTLALISAICFLYGAAVHNVQSATRSKSSYLGESGAWVMIGLGISLSFFASGGGLVLLFPVFVFFIACAALFSQPSIRFRLLLLLRHLSIAISAHLILVFPFVRNNQTFDLGLHRSRWVSPFSDFVSHWGIFLFIAVAYFGTLFFENREKRSYVLIEPGDFFSKHSLLITRWGAVLIFLGIMPLLGVMIGWVFALSVLGAVTASYFALIEIRSGSNAVARISSLTLFAFGFMVLAGPEIITINNDVARMNTVFKFWLQGWLLFSVASAIAAWEVWVYAQKYKVRSRSFYYPSTRFWVAAMACVLLIGLVYPLSSIGPRLDDRFSTGSKGLNGIAYLEENPVLVRYDNGSEAPASLIPIGEDLTIIKWLRESVAGSPTIVEWTGDSYDWNGRIATHTGLPAVLGWSSHQRQQRLSYQNMITERKRDVQSFYQVADPEFMTRFLLTYNVSYVIVGTQERRFGNEEALLSFDDHPGLNVVLEDGLNKIYIVDREALWTLTNDNQALITK